MSPRELFGKTSKAVHLTSTMVPNCRNKKQAKHNAVLYWAVLESLQTHQTLEE